MVGVVLDDWDRPCFASNESTANSGNGRGRDCRAVYLLVISFMPDWMRLKR